MYAVGHRKGFTGWKKNACYRQETRIIDPANTKVPLAQGQSAAFDTLLAAAIDIVGRCGHGTGKIDPCGAVGGECFTAKYFCLMIRFLDILKVKAEVEEILFIPDGCF